MNLVVPQQVKDRFSEVQAEVRGQLVLLQQLATTNYTEARQRLDTLPSELNHLWSGLRSRVQVIFDLAPRADLMRLQARIDELSSEIAVVANVRGALRGELASLIDDKLARWAAPIVVVESDDAAEVVEGDHASKVDRTNGKPKNGNPRRR